MLPTLKIYHLFRTEKSYETNNRPAFGWDTHQEFVVTAENSQDARRIADEIGLNPDPNSGVWLDETLTQCQYIGDALPHMMARVICANFRDG